MPRKVIRQRPNIIELRPNRSINLRPTAPQRKAQPVQLPQPPKNTQPRTVELSKQDLLIIND